MGQLNGNINFIHIYSIYYTYTYIIYIYICIFQRQSPRERGTEIFHHWFTPWMAATFGAGQAKARVQSFIQAFCIGGRDPNTQAIFRCLPQPISRDVRACAILSSELPALMIISQLPEEWSRCLSWSRRAFWKLQSVTECKLFTLSSTQSLFSTSSTLYKFRD